jgi:hypothetical protein
VIGEADIFNFANQPTSGHQAGIQIAKFSVDSAFKNLSVSSNFSEGLLINGNLSWLRNPVLRGFVELP